MIMDWVTSIFIRHLSTMSTKVLYSAVSNHRNHTWGQIHLYFQVFKYCLSICNWCLGIKNICIWIPQEYLYLNKFHCIWPNVCSVLSKELCTLLTDRPIQLNTISWLWEASCQAVINESRRFMNTYPPVTCLHSWVNWSNDRWTDVPKVRHSSTWFRSRSWESEDES